MFCTIVSDDCYYYIFSIFIESSIKIFMNCQYNFSNICCIRDCLSFYNFYIDYDIYYFYNFYNDYDNYYFYNFYNDYDNYYFSSNSYCDQYLYYLYYRNLYHSYLK